MISNLLIFRRADNFISRFLKKDFGHVLILLYTGARWVSIDPLRKHIQVRTYKKELNIDTIINDPQCTHAVMCIVDDNDGDYGCNAINFTFRLFNRLNCVGIAKYICGINKFILTPYKLYKYMKKCNNNGKFGRGIKSIDILK